MTTRHDLSSVQQAVWLDQILAPDVPSYNLGLAWRIDGDLDEALLASAIEDVAAGHDALRLVLGEHAGAPFQRVAPGAACIAPALDLSGHGDAEQRAWAHIRAEAAARFELYGRPLWSSQIVRVAPGRRYWLTRFHHLIADGASFAIFGRAVADAYERRLRGEAALADAPSYLEFIDKDRGYLASSRHAADEQFWRERFAELPPALWAARATGASAADRRFWTLDGGEFARIRDYFTAQGCTLQHFMLALLAANFARTHGLDEVVIGVPVHNRGAARDRRTLGMFSSMIPLGIRVDRDQSFDALMHAIAAELKRCYRHQRLPIQELNRALRLDRHGRRQLFDVTLAQEVYPEEVAIGGGRWVPVHKMYSGAGQSPLAVCVAEYPGAEHTLVELNYHRDAFAADEVERLQRRLARMTRAVLEDGGLPVGRLPLLDDAERHQVVAGWNATDTVYPAGLCVHELFEAQVVRTPDAVAVVDGDRRLRYGEVNARANQLARQLVRCGVGPDVPVGVCLERSAEMVIALLAVLKAGGCYLPLDPDYPPERLRRMVESGAPRVVLVDAVGDTVMAAVDAEGARTPRLMLSARAWPWAGEPVHNLPGRGGNRHLAYVIYTSGSTGTPKGVMNEHRGVVNRLSWMQQAYGLGAGDVVLQKTPFSFDVSVWELFWPLMTGAQLVMARPHGHKDPGYLTEVIRSAGVTTLHFVPSMLQAFLAHDGSARCTRVKRVICSGEALPATLVRSFHGRLPGVELHNLYGPTEAAVDVTAWACEPGAAMDAIPIGRPIANTQMYVLDDRMQPVPVGVVGELYIGGVQVARGYLGQPGLTAERFVADPFAGDAEARLYRTGDVGRWRADGAIEYLGRNDHQVKIRGVRIELGEIEARLAELAGVTEVVVVAREDVPGERRLVAYYTTEAATEAALDAEALRAHAAKGLAQAMIPSAYVRLAAMPVTANGKLDRKALPAPDGEAVAQQAYEAPEGAIEHRLAAIWAELLAVDRVGRRDNFFALGGHSLLAVQLIERMRLAGLHADVRIVFNAPTLAALAGQVGSRSDEVAVPPNRIPAGATRITPDMLTLVSLGQASIDAIVDAAPGGAAGVQDIYPLAPLQDGILFHHLVRKPDDADPYVLSGLLAFPSRARLDRFLAALQQVIDRHDILRTGIAWQGLEQPVQVVHRRAILPVEVLALERSETEGGDPDGSAGGAGGSAPRGIDPRDGDIAAQLEAGDPRHDAIDVTVPPLLRCRVAADERGRWLLHIRFHHLALDHTTLDAVLKEARALEDGGALPAPAPFRDFVAQAKSRVSVEEHEAFFRDLLGDIDEPTAPFGLLDVQGDGRGIAEASRTLAPELARAVRDRARALGVSAASLLHLAWALVLARTTGRRDVVFGTVLLGRMQGGAGADRALGVFINTLPVRIGVDSRGVAQAARDAHALLVHLLRHEHAPLALAQRTSGVPAQVPLFTSLVNYRFSGQDSDELALTRVLGDDIELMSSHERTSYPLSLNVDDLGHGLAITVQAAAEIGADRICDFVQTALGALVRALAEEPDRPAHSLDVLPTVERERVLVAWNATETEYPAGLCVHELFETQVVRTPDAIAVIDGERRLSYGELNARANQLARRLVECGVGRDVPVGVCLERSAEMVIGLYAVLKAGGCYLPLDPDYPAERLRRMIANGAPRVVLVDAVGDAVMAAVERSETGGGDPNGSAGGAGGRVPRGIDQDGAGTPRLMMSSRTWPWADEPTTNLPAAGGNGHLAYVIYTSGSTGTPKGVMNEHRGVVNRLSWMQQAYGLGAGDVVLQKTPFSFDVSVWEFFWPLMTGAQLVMARPHGHKDPAYLAEVIQATGVTTLHFVPSMLQAFVAYDGSGRCTGVRRVICSGEALPAMLVRSFHDRLPGVELHNLYGPTEAAVDVTAWACEPGAPMDAIPIGRPIANTQMYVLDERMQPVPAGVAGELYIGGVQVARGYLNQPELTAERFVADPFAGGRARLYRTGDLGRWRPDGAIEYLGRNDFQVKIRGCRIELGEVEARLSEVAGVDEVVVIARDEGAGGPRLVAYYTGAAAGDALRGHAARTLPGYMVPSAYVGMAAMPVTANGKLDRRALPAPDAATPDASYAAPRGEVEEIIAGLWSELLGCERVGRHDHFFMLGGHSLLAVQLVSRLRRVLGVELTLSELFAHPELDRLAARVSGAARSALPEIPMAERTGPAPVSLAQQRLWFLSRLPGASAAYHIRGAVRLDGALDRGALVRALARIVERHEALRTCFQVIDGQPMQVVQPATGLAPEEYEEHDVRGADDADAAARQLGETHAAAAFDLPRETPLRVQLVRVADQAHVLQVVMHHIASDGWSVGLLLDELSQLYAAFAAGQPDPLPAPALQYADCAVWQRTAVASGALASQAEFWRTTLAGAPQQLSLPWDRPRPAQQDHTGASIPVELDAALAKALRAVSRRHGVTMYMTLLASWAAVLSRLAGQDEVVIGSPVAGRQRAELEAVMGCFVNTLALRIDLGDDPTVGELLARTRAQVLAAQDHQDLPFDQVVEAVKPARSLAHTPLFQVLFDWQPGAAERSLRLPGLGVTLLPREVRTAQFDLALALHEGADGAIRGDLGYAMALFDRATIERYRGHWLRLLAALTADDRQAVRALPLLDDAERHQVVAGWNATDTAYPAGLCVHELFEAQAVRTPDAIAVVDGDRQLRYGELNARANQLARRLVECGVGPDVPVGVCLERSAEMVIGLYAVLKAGGCYLPLDPDYPPERLRRMVESGAPRVVLVDAVGDAVMTAVDGDRDGEGARRLRLSAGAWPWAGEPADNLPGRGDNRHLAYVIYTSGSTGTPKGVMNEHRGVVNRLSWMQQAYGLGAGDVVLQKTPFSFDVSVWEFFWPLMTGAQLVMARPHGHKDPGYLAEVIRSAGVTTLHFVPSMLQAFVAHDGSARCTGVKRVMCSGEALPATLVRSFHDRLPGVELHNLYGPTEAAVDVTAWACEPGAPMDAIPIGRPIANTRLYVLDERMQPVPVGVAGEIYIGGIQVARGYLGQPGLTAERFVADPFAGDADARLYRTGDVGRWRADGAIEYLGRNDHQVKIRGVRIELGEIEARLAELAGVMEVVVVAREDAPGERRLVAYYTTEAATEAAIEAALDAEALRAHAAKGLPPAMVPAAYVRLPAMPVTANGKLDRKALPAPDGEAVAQQAYEAPEGAIEHRLAAIWSELLAVERVGRRDSFFALGGHSLLAIKLLERMRRDDLHTDVVAIFTATTLSELAAQIRTAATEVNVPPNLIDRDPADGEAPSWASDVEELRL